MDKHSKKATFELPPYSHLPQRPAVPQLRRIPYTPHTGGKHGDVGLREAGSGGGDALAQVVEGEFGGVVGAAEVREPEPAHAVGTPGVQDGVRRLVIGEVADGTEDALLERLRVGAAQQALAVVVGLDDEQVGVADGGEDSVGDFATVGDDTDAAAGGAEQVAARGNRVV